MPKLRWPTSFDLLPSDVTRIATRHMGISALDDPLRRHPAGMPRKVLCATKLSRQSG
jgi:hypothetical protein